MRQTAEASRRRARRRAALVILAGLALTAFGLGVRLGASDRDGSSGLSGGSTASARVAAARTYAAGREGRVGFAIVDARGNVTGWNASARFVSASVAKVMLLVAYLRQPALPQRALTVAERALLAPMIFQSDNDAATAIYSRVGDQGLRALARRAGMTEFRIGATTLRSCGCRAVSWARAETSPRDQARLMRSLDALLPARHRPYARALLAGAASRDWGIPVVARPAGWRVYFKAGVRATGLGLLVHQVARVETPRRTRGLAVMTDGNPSRLYGRGTVAGIARRLIGRPT